MKSMYPYSIGLLVYVIYWLEDYLLLISWNSTLLGVYIRFSEYMN